MASPKESTSCSARPLGSLISVLMNVVTTLRSFSVDLRLNQVKNFILKSLSMCPLHSSILIFCTQYSKSSSNSLGLASCFSRQIVEAPSCSQPSGRDSTAGGSASALRPTAQVSEPPLSLDLTGTIFEL
ncbi:Os05g0145500 [Oryza sativa Japonica Group]|uniref:Os05g0145500 protein n=1 Tax=Oryza sativa subsp. japonica TaxID=39947 RepID=A0A0N7KK51_ORYSJ|nr:hypothetical protein EE612_027065 [Oryza sativa]BAS92241.1 Os05g0145500 [Oryza sativa Japonica Group]